ncbi:hypothetical protein [Stenotrophomonas maltophilia]|uniref:hypothetical protein n=1 Tax=Stenotrophomonas maltophilia TaxID=40324 RepID=UPI003BF8836D
MNQKSLPTPDEILEEIKKNFFTGQKRKFLPALLIAFIRFLRGLEAVGGKYESLDEFYEEFPLATKGRGGAGINTFVVEVDGKNKSIRKDYDGIAGWFRNDQSRFDFPSSAPHATQAWRDYTHWLEAILSYDLETLNKLEEDAKDYVLAALVSQAIDPTTVKREPPVFLLFLQSFDLEKKQGEISGAAYQGTVFGYIRADSPHLQVEVGKVRTGSKREKRVGDVDARDGDKLVLSAEVKQFVVGEDDVADFSEFARLISLHQALGLVVALDFEDEAAKAISAMGLEPISRADLIERVRIWDPLKQRMAMNAILYYADFREQNSALYKRIGDFMEEVLSEESVKRKEVGGDSDKQNSEVEEAQKQQAT